MFLIGTAFGSELVNPIMMFLSNELKELEKGLVINNTTVRASVLAYVGKILIWIYFSIYFRHD